MGSCVIIVDPYRISVLYTINSLEFQFFRIPFFRISVQTSYFGSLKELFRDTILLNTRAPGLESFASTQKKPFLTNWKLS